MIDYKPSFIFRNRHINTCFPTLFRKINVSYKRERYDTYDGDFIDVDWIKNNNDRAVILCHGLEGSSKSKYIQGMSRYFSERGWDTAAINYRGCSGEVNRKVTFYHAALTDDIKLVIEKCKNYKYIAVIGFSLGANMTLKYFGTEKDIPDNVICGTAVSPPCEFFSSSERLKKFENIIYKLKFLGPLKEKAIAKAKDYKGLVDVEKIRKAKNIEEFDDAFTARFFGFKGVKDYYKKASSIKDIPNIKKPVYILMPLDDPIMGKECYPYKEAEENKFITLETPRYGGHVGFSSFKHYPYVTEERIFDFVNECVKKSENKAK